ncbi:MAG: hypothetical protein HQL50_04230 [Magnetococcales bacterium]|nr:hypothetical protein [Magnetococcales bacterium]
MRQTPRHLLGLTLLVCALVLLVPAAAQAATTVWGESWSGCQESYERAVRNAQSPSHQEKKDALGCRRIRWEKTDDVDCKSCWDGDGYSCRRAAMVWCK